MFQVFWSEVVLDRLAEIVLGADLETQRQMADAVEALNLRLSRRPFDEGESRNGAARVVFVSGLIVAYWVDASARVVRVEGVSRYGR